MFKSKVKTMRDILENPKASLAGAENSMCLLWRTILHGVGATPVSFSYRLRCYVYVKGEFARIFNFGLKRAWSIENPGKKVPKKPDGTMAVSNSGNIMTMLSKPVMSADGLDEGLKILGAEDVVISASFTVGGKQYNIRCQYDLKYPDLKLTKTNDELHALYDGVIKENGTSTSKTKKSTK